MLTEFCFYTRSSRDREDLNYRKETILKILNMPTVSQHLILHLEELNRVQNRKIQRLILNLLLIKRSDLQ